MERASLLAAQGGVRQLNFQKMPNIGQAAYAMASHGEEGVRHLIRTLMGEIDLSVALSGLTSIAAVDRNLIAPD